MCWSMACRPGSTRDDRDHVAWPPEVAALLDGGPVSTEVLYPIAWGGRMPYPYARAQAHFRQTYERFGPRKLLWGSDMPNVGRYCTYRQALGYLWDHADFLSSRGSPPHLSGEHDGAPGAEPACALMMRSSGHRLGVMSIAILTVRRRIMESAAFIGLKD